MQRVQDMRRRMEEYLKATFPDKEQRMGEYLKARFPQREELSVVVMERMSVGFSYETYLCTATWKEAQGQVSESLVIRMEPERGCQPPYDVRHQYEVQKRLQGTGVPVPKVHWLEMDSQVLGRPFFVMEKVEGELLYMAYMTYPEYQEQLAKDYVSILAKIHELDWQALGLSFLSVPENDRQYAEKEIAKWEWVVEENQYSPQPVIAELFSWLKRNIPRAERTTLCHGEFNSGNSLTRDGRIVATLDWEQVGVGDPISDIGWARMCMATLTRNFWGQAELVHAYEELTGVKVNEESLLFWEILAFVKLAAIAYAGLRASLESKSLDVRLQLGDENFASTLQDQAAQMLGF